MMWLLIFIVGGLCVAASIGLSYSTWMSGSVFNILKNVAKKNITTVIGKDCEDELGRITNDYNDFLYSINEFVTHIRTSVSETKEITYVITSSLEESNAALEEFRASTESINKKTSKLDMEITRSCSAFR